MAFFRNSQPLFSLALPVSPGREQQHSEYPYLAANQAFRYLIDAFQT
jgi:hypothetical protein